MKCTKRSRTIERSSREPAREQVKIMKGLIFLLLFLGTSWPVVCQEKGRGVSCAENQDKLYDRRNVLERFAAVLSASVPEYQKVGLKFYVEDEMAAGFGVYDLTDPSNVDSGVGKECVEFIDNHIYHVVPGLVDYSFSHIIMLEGGSLKVFRSINCPGRGDRLEDVLEYLRPKLADDKNKDEIINRVINYRKYGDYAAMDNFSGPWCKSVDN
jgi:hypothetical protein